LCSDPVFMSNLSFIDSLVQVESMFASSSGFSDHCSSSPALPSIVPTLTGKHPEQNTYCLPGFGSNIVSSSSSRTAGSGSPINVSVLLSDRSSNRSAPLRGRSFACDLCSARYHHAKSLRDHKQSKHLGKRYACNVVGCNASVAHKKNLRRHMGSRHGLDKVQETRSLQY
jgi:hypothetical protein